MPLRTVTKVGGEVSSGDADIAWAETPKITDKNAPKPVLPEQLVTREVHRQNPLAIQAVTRMTSVRVVPAVTASYTEPLKVRDVAPGRVDDLKIGRSGTPDSDILGDGWTDGVAIRNGDNHGNESPLPVAGALLLATTQYAWMKWNLTTPKFIGLAHQAGIGTARISIWSSQALAVAQTLRINISVKTTNPFTESTLNWTNQPTLGTNQVTRSISVLVGATNGRYDIDFTAAEFAPFIGNWMLLRMDSDALVATPCNVVSREGATGERPLLSFDFRVA